MHISVSRVPVLHLNGTESSIVGYGVGFPLDVDPSTADNFFKDLPYE